MFIILDIISSWLPMHLSFPQAHAYVKETSPKGTYVHELSNDL